MAKTYGKGNRSAVIKHDVEWDDWIVKFYVDNVYQCGADYHAYDDEEDAILTAKDFCGITD